MKKKKLTTNEKIQISFLVLIGILIFALIVAIFVFIKNVEEVKTEPIEYAIKHTDLDWCTCMDESVGIAINYPRVFGEEIRIQNWTS